MSDKFVSIQDASEISKKSIQTIRRAIKAKKLKFRKKKTAQGFNYLVSHDSLVETYKLRIETPVAEKVVKKAEVKTEVKSEVKAEKKVETGEVAITTADFREFTKSLESMINQHADERQNFLRLVNTLQEKIFVLENQLNLLAEPKKKWYQMWK